ncbi:MAG TPA: NAD-dependent epimerase/dehydratase family protein [Nitrososphaera sp.]|jgi:UDP-glucose 4-epimerase
MTILVTGGAGFIGSNLVRRLLEAGEDTHVLDNLSSGRVKSLEPARKYKNFWFHNVDLLQADPLALPKDCKTIYHLAANPEVRISATNPSVHFSQNVVATFNLLEAARRIDAQTLVFASTSTVYGDAATVPTPENYSPLEPISMYGASKLACESLIVSYAHTYGMRAVIYRLANIIGEDSTHGVIYDFVNKLLKDPTQLEVLGDGTQNKSYLHISDCIAAILMGVSLSKERVGVFNVGSRDQIDVRKIATAVMTAMRLSNVKMNLTGGVDNGRGWKGDVKNMLLDVQKIESLGWSPKYDSTEAVHLTAKRIVDGLVYTK